jgi:putative ABC transport system permease protein
MNLWLFAIKTLLADRGKLATALVGVAFSVVLINVQGGLFLGLIRKATLIIDHGHADIWVGHRQMHCVDLTMDVPRDWVHRVRSVRGVARAEPYLIGYANMTLPNGGFEGVALIGVERHNRLGEAWQYAEGGPDAIRLADGIVVDACEDEKLAHPQVGELREVAGQRARIVAKSRGVTNFLIAPYAFTTFERAADYLGRPRNLCSFILVELEDDANASEVCQNIHNRVPELDVLTRKEFSSVTVNFWLTRTGMGISFGLATLIGLGVGLVMVAQTLHALALDRQGEYGTLRAIGAREIQIVTILVVQSATIGLAGAVLGLTLVSVIAAYCSTPIAPIVVPAWLSLGSSAMLVAVCLLAAGVPYVRLSRIDPHAAFRN